MSDEQDRYLPNDPGRAGGLISDAQGEFVREQPGGAFDPRAFRPGRHTGPEQADGDEEDGATGRPPVDGIRMSSPGEEIDKAG